MARNRELDDVYSALALIRVLDRDIFSRTRIPYAAVSDNGPQFISKELAQFMNDNRIKHILTPTYHPKSNGLVERLVGSFKTQERYEKDDLYEQKC